MDQENSNPKVSRLIFDDSIENHFKAMYTISNLCGLAREKDDFDATELQRLSSTITFWREWRQYCYEPRVCRFASAVGGLRGRDVVDGVSLPQFSSANVPKVEKLSGDNSSSETRWLEAGTVGREVIVAIYRENKGWDPSCSLQIRGGMNLVRGRRSDRASRKHEMLDIFLDDFPFYSKDVVLYAGGPVWALDWCPSSHQNSDHQFNCQFLAVAAHPPNSSYHKIGAPVNGIGVVQIWCLLNMNLTEEKLPPLKKPKGRPKKEPAIDPANQSKDKGALCSLKKQKERPKKVLGVKRPRGRPKKENTTQDPTKEIATDDPTYQSENKEELPSPKKQRGRPRKKNAISDMVNSVNVDMEEEESLFSMKLREKPSKKNAIKDLAAWKEKKSTSDRSTKSKAIKETVNNLDEDSQFIPALSVEFPEDSSGYFGLTKLNTQKSSVTNSNRAAAQKTRNEAIQKNDSCHTSPHLLTKQGDNEFSIAVQEEQKSCADALTSQEVPSNNRYFEKCCDISPCPLTQNDDNRYSIEAHQEAKSYGQVETASSEKVPNNGSFDNRTTTTSVPEELALPRPVFFLEHNGKVAWDVKWRPYSHSELECKHRMGYLAVLLGNGSLEVWEVPSPNAVKIMYSSCRKEGNDPRFLKLESVFKCSNLKWGDKQSIPLTLEWSPSLPHDLLLVGCHDGTVGLWKFSTIGSYQDTRPLLSFSADIAPIRALAWYPDGS
ncbi:hypothetical protein GIB67_012933 [Kingdonia uniflora]|uniref:Uncharacterized protein n=1 Tax=Kingdonia uniflora TaxID=39325 RepID=A0A7J7NFS4_9MAGN|nr:hypothetical protein GIB67_012933 [Kingdonia uniflora]